MVELNASLRFLRTNVIRWSQERWRVFICRINKNATTKHKGWRYIHAVTVPFEDTRRGAKMFSSGMATHGHGFSPLAFSDYMPELLKFIRQEASHYCNGAVESNLSRFFVVNFVLGPFWYYFYVASVQNYVLSRNRTSHSSEEFLKLFELIPTSLYCSNLTC